MQLGRTEKSLSIQAEAPLLEPGHTYGSITDKIGDAVLTRKTPFGWMVGFALGAVLFTLFLMSVSYLFYKGVGVWGINIPVGWGFAIITFVWWIGIGHAGTLISAILFLFRQEWRTSINRFAEAMTLFAVACAGLYPILHLGRPWLFYWIIPYPNTFTVWPQFRSALAWDVFALTTYAITSALFWFIGLIPDLAAMRDKATHPWLRYLYGILAMGWRGSARHWHHHDRAYLLLAAIATPLVVSVHTVVSFDFAIAVLPGWHTTVQPPFFVAGAIFSGFAMVITLMIPMRKIFKMEDFITVRHFDLMAKVLLTTGLVVTYGYVLEFFTGWYSGSQYEISLLLYRLGGPYMIAFWSMIACNALIIQLLWFKQLRTNLWLLFVISIIVNIGMWLERFVIIVVSLSADFLPSSWHLYAGTFWDWTLLFGTIGLFLTLIFLFVRTLPMISIFEVRELLFKTEGQSQPKRETEVQA
jgi:Ni/Fe-hydrogenase subunit HybB-like protein